MSNEESNDRLMTEKEYGEFDVRCTLEHYRQLLLDLNSRLERMEGAVESIEDWIASEHVRKNARRS